MNKSDSLKDSSKKLKKSVRRQESSQEIEDRHQDLLGHIKAVQYTHDLQGQLLSVNRETTEFLGYDKNSLLNMNIRNLLAPEVRHEFDTYLTEMKRQGNTKGLMLVQTATGEKRFLIYNNTLRTEGVAIPTVQGIAYDITKYIQTERELRQVSGQLSIVLESLPIVCYICKAEGDYGATYITNNVKTITGFEQTDFTSKPSFWTNRIHPEDAPRIFADLPQIFTKGYHEHQYRWQVADGSYKWFYDYTRLMKSSDGKNYIIGMMQDITERKRAEEALLHAAQQWRATFDGINDFVSLLDPEGKILRCNNALSDFVEKPFNEIINHSCWEIIFGTTTPIEDCPFIRMKETLHRETTILSVNDLWLNVSVDPVFDQDDHLIGAVNIISDITKRKQAEEAVIKLSQENATVAEIGRIISSTLNIEEVYERFAEEVRKLISFDRISIHIVNPDNNTTSTVYVSGIDVPGRRGDTTPLKGTAVSECIRTRSGMLIQSESVDECLVHFPALLPTFQAGLKSIMYVPLISKDRVIGALSLRSAKTNAYTDQDVKLTENIGNQIAGAIANAQLFIERKRAEEAVNRLAQENAIIAEIGRIISSTLEIEEVYEQFAKEVHKLILFDGIAINMINYEQGILTVPFVSEVAVPGCQPGEVLPLAGSVTQKVMQTRSGLIIQTEDRDEIKDQFPTLLTAFDKGLRSIMVVPLIYKDQVIGALHFRSVKSEAYSDKHLELAASIGNQIAGAIANAQLFVERKRAEENLRASEEQYRTLFHGVPVGLFRVSPMGEILDVNKALMSILGYRDRESLMAVRVDDTYVNPKDRVEFKTLIETQGVVRHFETQLRRYDGTTIWVESNAHAVTNSQGQTIYYEGSFIDITHRKQAEEALLRSEGAAKRLAQENATVAEIGRIISSTLNIEEVYERFAEEVRKLIPLDRIALTTITPDHRSGTIAYVLGVEVKDRNQGAVFPLTGSLYEEIFSKQSGILVQTEDESELAERYPILLSTFQVGLRSMISVPLVSKGQVIGVLHIRSLKPNAYTDQDVRLAESIGNQIAGAIANAQLFAERKQAEEALRTEKQRFQTVSENAPFGMAMIDQTGTYKYINPKFKELFGYDLNDIPDGKAWYRKAFPDPAYRHHAISFWINDNRLGSHRGGEKTIRTFTVTCKDGTEKIIEFFPVELETGEFLTSFVDITHRKEAEEALRRSEEAATRLAQENAIVAEIGRIISSSLDINDVYERFAEKVHELIPLDRISINIINHEEKTSTITYVDGFDVGDRRVGVVMPFAGTVTEGALRARSSLLIQAEDLQGIACSFPALSSSFEAGIRSMMAVPLISKDEVIGVLHIQSLKPNAYTESEVRLAEEVSAQIAGAIANAQLFIERKRAEEALQKSEEEAKRLAKENAIIAEIGRIISSSLNIDEVYEHFAEEVRKLIPFDRIVINFIDIEKGTVVNVYMAGKGIVDRRVEEILPLKGSGNAEMVRTKSTFLIQTEDFNEYKDRFPMLLSTFQSGFRSIMNVPLFSKGQIIGGLLLRSFMPYAYSDKDVRLAERIGTQIAGAIANAQLFIERKRAEEKMRDLEDQLRQAQKMEAIGRLAGGVAHDFNNLLTAIKGYSQISLAMLKEGDPLKENVEEIQKAADRAASLTKQLLVFSRSQILELKVFHLNTILQDLGKMLHRIIGEDIELVYSLSNDLGQVKTDPSQMEQVILNLAINAKDAMPSGGKLTIETSNATLDESYADSHIGITSGDYVMLSVSDTGMGMTPEVKERIFEPFFTTKEKGKGTGLGLSIVYGIIKQSGGTIWVYSELGLGTTFKVYLPRVEEDAESLRPTTVPTKSFQGSETILVVEDEEIVRKMACKILEKNGYRVLEASNGEEALHIVQKQNGNPIHLVVTDVVMPGMSGRQLVDRLVFLWPQTKALYMSGYTNDAIVHHGVLDPGIAFIQKPFTPDAFTSKVREILDGH